MRSKLVLGTAVASAAAACGGSSGGSTPETGGALQHPARLVADVGHDDAFTISVTDGHGHAITDVAAGTYTLVVHDESSIHDFHISGAGVDDATTVAEKTTKTFNVTLTPGTYTFICDPHASQMHGSFRVR